MKKECDVLVVGAGPAGVSAAFFLKHFDNEKRLNVELIDRLDSNKYDFYHDMCGEAASSKLLENIFPLKPEGIIGKVKLVKEYYPGNVKIQTKMDGLLIDRSKFFKSIIKEFEKKGGEFNDSRTVEDFSQKEGKVIVKINGKTKKYDYLVSADGANSLFRKKLGIEGKTKTLIQYIVDKKPEEDTIKFYYDEKYKGDYKWEFPHEGRTKIGYPIIKGTVFKPKERILKKQARMVAYGGIKKQVHNRIMLIGDAACQTNPITKGGIRAGMIAGKMCAEAINKNNPSQYEIQWGKSKFSDNILNIAFEQLTKLNNKEMEEHIKTINELDKANYIKKSIIYTKILLYYRQYLDIYKAYELCNKIGW